MRKIVHLFALLLLAGSSQAQCTDLFFSEYIEGSSSNKAFEIYNPTASDIDLSDYVVYRNNNGSPFPTDSLFPEGILVAGDVFVTANDMANATILAEMDTTHTMTFYNGDDAMYLVKISTGDTLDLIGEIGNDPGSGWPVGTGATNNNTLVRMSNVQLGQTNWAIGATQWNVFPIDMADSLGAHTMIACGAPCTPTAATISPTTCVSYTAPDGMVYTTSGMYTATTVNSQGCDSVITIDLTINDASTFVINETVCDSFTLNGTTYNFAGTYTQMLLNAAGCDSTITLNLDLTASPSAPTVNGTLDYCDGDTPTALTIGGAGVTDSLIISGVLDATLPGGVPKAVELYALEDIADLSAYGIGSATNGGGTDGEEFTFPAVAVTAGTYIHISTDSTNFNAFLGLFPDFVEGTAVNVNGDDAIELFHNGVVIDVFGDINTDGTGELWEYLDGWAYRKNNAAPNGGVFAIGEWEFSGINALDGQATNAGAPISFPIETYTFVPQLSTINWYDDVALTNMVGTGTSYTPGITSGNITYYVTAENTGGTTCLSDAAIVDVTFNPAPTVAAFATDTVICENANVTLTGAGAATYQWDNGVVDGTAFTATATTTYTVIGTDQIGCTGTDSVTITVTPAPTTALAALPTVCNTDVAFTLSQGSPVGGTYSGSGVTNGEFDPATAGAGTITITYEYTDSSGCTGIATADLLVNDCASIDELEAGAVVVYPNPASDILNVQSNFEIQSIQIVDLSGVIVANGVENSISVANLASGMYVINVTTETGIATQTFVKK